MGLDGSNVFLFSATRLEDVIREMHAMQPRAVIVDSIQTVYLDDVMSSAGSVAQVSTGHYDRPCLAAASVPVEAFLLWHTAARLSCFAWWQQALSKAW